MFVEINGTDLWNKCRTCINNKLGTISNALMLITSCQENELSRQEHETSASVVEHAWKEFETFAIGYICLGAIGGDNIRCYWVNIVLLGWGYLLLGWGYLYWAWCYLKRQLCKPCWLVPIGILLLTHIGCWHTSAVDTIGLLQRDNEFIRTVMMIPPREWR